MTLEAWATAQAERLIGALGDRWTHVQAVANKARGLAAVLSAEDADLLVAAALVHDVGYAPSLNRLGFHAVDGARFLRAQGQERLARLVAHHSGARFEAEERDLVEQLAAFPVEDGMATILGRGQGGRPGRRRGPRGTSRRRPGLAVPSASCRVESTPASDVTSRWISPGICGERGSAVAAGRLVSEADGD